MGSDRPIHVPLWSETDSPSSFWERLLSLFGVEPASRNVCLVIRYSKESGFTIEGPSWKDIALKLRLSTGELVRRLVAAIRDEYELAHGWEASLNDALVELDELDLDTL